MDVAPWSVDWVFGSNEYLMFFMLLCTMCSQCTDEQDMMSVIKNLAYPGWPVFHGHSLPIGKLTKR